MTISQLSAVYLARGCPDKRGEKRTDEAQKDERDRLERIGRLLGKRRIDRIGWADCNEYGAANQHRKRAADRDLQTLSNLMTFAVLERKIQANPVLGRARVQKSSEVRHCRECMPADQNVLHTVARELLKRPQFAAAGWQMLFEAYTGCRTSEILEFRKDAATRTEPGFYHGNYLYLRRLKAGGFPYVLIEPHLKDLIDAHHLWWQTYRVCESQWWFPAPDGRCLSRFALVNRLRDTCQRLGVPQITSHGLRAYYVTVHRSWGKSNEQVAALIGDKTAGLIETTYGSLPEVWSGGEKLQFHPTAVPLAWE